MARTHVVTTITLVTLVILSACSPRSLLAPLPQQRGTGTVPTVVTSAEARPTPADHERGGPWAKFCGGFETAPACAPRLIEICDDIFDPESCHTVYADQVAVCVKKQNGPTVLGYVWECALRDWFPK